MIAKLLQILNFTTNSARDRTCPSVDIGYLGSECLSLVHSKQHVRILPTSLYADKD